MPDPISRKMIGPTFGVEARYSGMPPLTPYHAIGHTSRIVALLGLLLTGTIACTEAAAQESVEAQLTGTPTREATEAHLTRTPTRDAALTQRPSTHERGPWWTAWSWAAPHDRILAGMTSIHLYHLDEGWNGNGAVGLVAKGFFGATFITTNGPRGWVLGVERAWLEGAVGPVRTMLGFRTGLVYGYNRDLGYVAEWSPILPYIQPLALIRLGPATVDLAYTWVVVSLTGGLTLW